MKKFLLLTFVLTTFYASNAFAQETIDITCSNPSINGYIGGFSKDSTAFLGFNSGQNAKGLTTIVPSSVAIKYGPSCSASPYAVVGGAVVPAISMADFAYWYDLTLGVYEFKNVFSCFCKLNPNLLDGCEAEYEYKSSSYTDYYVDGYCEKGVDGEGTVKKWTFWEHSEYSYPSCFVAGTKVSTPSGDKTIETLKVGDEVLSYDHKEDVIKSSKVTKVFKHENKKYGELYLSNGVKIQVTPNHPFYSVDKKKYVAVGKLHPKDKLYLRTSDNKMNIVTVDKFVKPAASTTVYNIEVDAQHNYFAKGILVHNKI